MPWQSVCIRNTTLSNLTLKFLIKVIIIHSNSIKYTNSQMTMHTRSFKYDAMMRWCDDDTSICYTTHDISRNGCTRRIHARSRYFVRIWCVHIEWYLFAVYINLFGGAMKWAILRLRSPSYKKENEKLWGLTYRLCVDLT